MTVRLRALAVAMAAMAILATGCVGLGPLDELRTQFVALRYVDEAESLMRQHPLDRERVYHALQRATALRPEDEMILQRAVIGYIDIQAYQEALPCIERLTAMTGNPMLLQRGECLLRTGQTRDGEALILRAVQQAAAQGSGVRDSRLYAQVLNNAGYALADADVSLHLAGRLIEEAVRLAPLEAAYVDSLGWVLYRTGDLKGAAFYLERAVRQMEGNANPTMYYHLGVVYAGQGKRFWAERALNRALEIDPSNQSAQEALRKLRYELPQPGRV